MSTRIGLRVTVAGLALALSGLAFMQGAQALAAAPEVKREWLDTTSIEPDQRRVLDQTVGYAPAAIDADMRWIGAEGLSWETLRGKVVVLQSWTRSTEMGRAATRRTQALLKDFKPEDVQVIALHTPEAAEGVEDFLERKPAGMPVLVDAKGYFCDDMGVGKKPVSIVIDRQGAVRYAGASMGGLKDAVKALAAETFDPNAAAPQPVPAVDVRANSEEEAAKPKASTPSAGGRFPRHNSDDLSATNLQGKKGPTLQVESWMSDKPDLSGKVVIIDFWATWCGPCVRSIPHVNDIQRKFKDHVVVVGLSDEDTDTISNFMNKTQMNYSVATDTQARTKRGYGVQGIPHIAVISPDGVVRWQGHPVGLTDALVKQVVDASGLGAKPTDGASEGPFRWTGPRPTEQASAE